MTNIYVLFLHGNKYITVYIFLSTYDTTCKQLYSPRLFNCFASKNEYNNTVFSFSFLKSLNCQQLCVFISYWHDNRLSLSYVKMVI